jgi:peptidoglycan hydrolase-like protein with peptidoglycan-binding domain
MMCTHVSDHDSHRRRSGSTPEDDARPAVQRVPGKSSRAEARYGAATGDRGGEALPFMELMQLSAGATDLGGAQPAVQRKPAAVVQMKGEPQLKRGSSGKHVKELQQRLNAKATTEPPLGVDGTFEEKTEAAVIAFQHTHTDTTGEQLDPDGIVGKLTWGAINLEHATPEIDASTEAMGAHIAKEMDKNNNDPKDAHRGVYYDSEYKATFPDKFQDDWSNGYADATYFDRIGYMEWRLKPGKSASAAIQSWLRGLTIAECASAIVTMQHDAVRAAIGDKKFDDRFGSTDKKVPEKQRLHISQYTDGTGVDPLVEDTEESARGDGGDFGSRPLQPGDWCYFYNHPKYLLKHPGGAFQGENSLYVGRDDSGAQLFSGMGIDKVTEMGMLEAMIYNYNMPRDEWDEKALARKKDRNGGVLPDEYDESKRVFPDQLTSPQQILDEPAYEIDGTTRKGGFIPESGRRLNPKKVEALK